MRKTLSIILGSIALLAGALILYSPVAIESVRVAVVPGACPVDECPAGTVSDDNTCLCYTDAASVTGERTTLSATPDQLYKVIACPKGVVRTVSQPTLLPLGCVVAAENLLVVASTGIEGDLESKLATACKPCVITHKSWGPCPRCILEPGGCAAACP